MTHSMASHASSMGSGKLLFADVGSLDSTATHSQVWGPGSEQAG